MTAARVGWQRAQSLVKALGADCDVASNLARLALSHPGEILPTAVFSQGVAFGVAERVAEDFAHRGWLSRAPGGWLAPPAGVIPEELPGFLEGAAAMRAAFPVESRATAVVTMPPDPSAVGAALPATGIAYAELIPTTEAFERIASVASTMLTVMTPFLNSEGLGWALTLFRLTAAPKKHLVVRGNRATLDIIDARRDDLRSLGVEVLRYTLTAPGGVGYETFHAKVVLADASFAYVGSANLLAHARHSMELGILADGRAARVVSSVVRAVESVAVSYRL